MNPATIASGAPINVNDLTSLDGIKSMGRDKNPESIRKVAEQFESMFVKMMMKTMRQTNELFGKDNFLNSSEGKMYQDMLDNQTSVNMSSGRGIGLADTLYRQLMQQYNLDWEEKSGEAKPDDAKTNGLDSYKTQEQPFTVEGARRFTRSMPVSAPTSWSETLANTKQLIGEGMESFVQQLAPAAKAIAEKLGISEQALVAQAALETGWGKHVIEDQNGNSSFNLFNIKAKNNEPSITIETTEYRDGLPLKERAEFKRYTNIAQSFEDYGQLISGSKRYQEALAQGRDSDAYVEQLQQAGYATDPNYADKIKSIMNDADFRQLWK